MPIQGIQEIQESNNYDFKNRNYYREKIAKQYFIRMFMVLTPFSKGHIKSIT